MKDLIIFEENLTADGLEAIIKESKTWPVVALNRTQYDLVYEQHQRFKRLELACRKKAKELENEEKSRSKDYIGKIQKDLEFVQGILNPLILQLGDSRQRYDDEIEAYKMEAARVAAIEQEKEYERQRLLRATQRRIEEEKQAEYEESAQRDLDEAEAWGIYNAEKVAAEQEIEAEKQRVISSKLADEQAKLKREKYEFECEKERAGYTAIQAEIEIHYQRLQIVAHAINKNFNIVRDRLDFDEAWEAGHVKEYGPGNNGECISSYPTFPKTEDVKPHVDLAQEQKRGRAIIHASKEFLSMLNAQYKLGFSNEEIQNQLSELITRFKNDLQMFIDAVNQK